MNKLRISTILIMTIVIWSCSDSATTASRKKDASKSGESTLGLKSEEPSGDVHTTIHDKTSSDGVGRTSTTRGTTTDRPELTEPAIIDDISSMEYEGAEEDAPAYADRMDTPSSTVTRKARAAEHSVKKSVVEKSAGEFSKEITPDPTPGEMNRHGLLTAGRWSDLDNWEFWSKVINKDEWKPQLNNWGFNPKDRFAVVVKNKGIPVVDAEVKLEDQQGQLVWTARTNNEGEAELYANMFKRDGDIFNITALAGAKRKSLYNVTASGNKAYNIELPASRVMKNNVDILFMIDATGSMGDEIEYLKVELEDVMTRVKKEQTGVNLKLSCNVYRDHGDDYVVRSFPFTTDVKKAVSDLSSQYAGGGGDYEEAVEEGLANAIHKHKWSTEARTRLLFLVLDAPPHRTAVNLKKIQKATKEAAKLGIRIIPIASSGVNKDTEFLMRFLSMTTEGKYVFLTDHSGIGNSHIEPTIGSYKVEFLNELLVDLINKYVKEIHTT